MGSTRRFPPRRPGSGQARPATTHQPGGERGHARWPPTALTIRATSPSSACLDAAGAQPGRAGRALPCVADAGRTTEDRPADCPRSSSPPPATGRHRRSPRATPHPSRPERRRGKLRACPQRCAANQVRASATVADGRPIQAHARQRAVNSPRSSTMQGSARRTLAPRGLGARKTGRRQLRQLPDLGASAPLPRVELLRPESTLMAPALRAAPAQLHARQRMLSRVTSRACSAPRLEQARKLPEHLRVHEHALQPLGTQLVLDPSGQRAIIHRHPRNHGLLFGPSWLGWDVGSLPLGGVLATSRVPSSMPSSARRRHR